MSARRIACPPPLTMIWRMQAQLRQTACDGAKLPMGDCCFLSASRLRQLGLRPRIKAEADGRKFPFVLFAAPPSGSEDYPTEVLFPALLLVLPARAEGLPMSVNNCCVSLCEASSARHRPSPFVQTPARASSCSPCVTTEVASRA